MFPVVKSLVDNLENTFMQIIMFKDITLLPSYILLCSGTTHDGFPVVKSLGESLENTFIYISMFRDNTWRVSRGEIPG